MKMRLHVSPLQTFAFVAGALVSSSAAFLFQIDGNSVVASKGARAVVLVLLLVFAVAFYLFNGLRNKHNIPSAVVWFALFVMYGTSSSILHNESGFLSSLIRLSTYIFFLLFFYRFTTEKGWEAGCDLLASLILGVLFSSILFGLKDVVLGVSLQINSASRISGNIGSPVGYSCLLFLCVLSLFALRGKISGSFQMLLALTSFALIVATGTRVIILFSVMLAFLFAWLSIKSVFIKIAAPLMFVAVGYFLFFESIAQSDFATRMALFFSQDIESDSSTYFRVLILSTIAENFMLSQLIFGIGLGSFPLWFERVTAIQDVAPHFEFVWLIVEFGIIGTTFYFIYLFRVFLRMKDKYHRRTLSGGQFFCAIIIVSSHLTVFQFANPFYFYPLGMVYFSVIGVFISDYKSRKSNEGKGDYVRH